MDINEIMKGLSQLFSSGDNSSGGAVSFAAPNNTYNPTQTAAPSFGTQAGNEIGSWGNGTADTGLGAGLGMNVGTGQLALGGLGALNSIFGGLQSGKLAKDQFKFTKDITNTNLNNSIKSYNTTLDDRINSRAAVQGESSSWAQDYLDKNRLSR